MTKQATPADEAYIGQLLEELGAMAQALNEESDRAMVVLAGAYLDALLEKLIRRKLIDHEDPSFGFSRDERKVFADLHSANGPFSTFSARTTVACALRLIDPTAFRGLHFVRRIRNRFAHSVQVSFEDAQLKAWCAELWTLFRDQLSATHVTPRAQFYWSVHQLMALIGTSMTPSADGIVGNHKAVPLNTSGL